MKIDKESLIPLLIRLKQPSSYAGLGAILLVFHFNASPGLLTEITDVASALAGLAAFLLNGDSSPSPSQDAPK